MITLFNYLTLFNLDLAASTVGGVYDEFFDGTK